MVIRIRIANPLGGIQQDVEFEIKPPEQSEPDRLEGLVRVTELEDQISAAARKHRQVGVGVLVALVILVATAIGVLRGASDWIWYLVGGLVALPYFPVGDPRPDAGHH